MGEVEWVVTGETVRGERMTTEPEAGRPCPSVWPLRVKPKGARSVHAGRETRFTWEKEINTACRAWNLSLEREVANERVLDPATEVTCKGCLKRLARPLSISEAWAFRTPPDSDQTTRNREG